MGALFLYLQHTTVQLIKKTATGSVVILYITISVTNYAVLTIP